MKYILFFSLILACRHAAAAESPAPAHFYLLWDGQESIERYAQRVGFPPSKTLDLGNNVKLEMALIPAGQFVMGTPEPTPVDVAVFRKKIITGQAFLGLSGSVFLVLFGTVVCQAFRKRQRPNFSLLRLLGMTVTAGVTVLSSMHWWMSVQTKQKAEAEYLAAKANFEISYPDENPAHLVTLTRPIYMGKYPITQEQYEQLMGSNPSNIKNKNFPVENVSWLDSTCFCKKLSDRMKESISLPTEAEWEHACRAGTNTNFFTGDTEADLDKAGWYHRNSGMTAHVVGEKKANTWGLFDMHGNVFEWCLDWKGPYLDGAVANPQGPGKGQGRVIRGGDWTTEPKVCRSASRAGNDPNHKYFFIGFRIVLRVQTPSDKSNSDTSKL